MASSSSNTVREVDAGDTVKWSRFMPARPAEKDTLPYTWSNASLMAALDGSARNVSGSTITQFSGTRQWNCPYCFVHTKTRGSLRRHLRQGICVELNNQRSEGHGSAFHKWCTCKGELLWPRPAWANMERQRAESAHSLQMRARVQ